MARGTTAVGGRYRNGTVFSITTSGTETVLHSFNHATGAWYPLAALVDVDGTDSAVWTDAKLNALQAGPKAKA